MFLTHITKKWTVYNNISNTQRIEQERKLSDISYYIESTGVLFVVATCPPDYRRLHSISSTAVFSNTCCQFPSRLILLPAFHLSNCCTFKTLKSNTPWSLIFIVLLFFQILVSCHLPSNPCQHFYHVIFTAVVCMLKIDHSTYWHLVGCVVMPAAFTSPGP